MASPQETLERPRNIGEALEKARRVEELLRFTGGAIPPERAAAAKRLADEYFTHITDSEPRPDYLDEDED